MTRSGGATYKERCRSVKLGDVATELIEQLEAGAREVTDYFRHLDPVAARTLPITASEHPGGRPWTSKDHLAHLVVRERDFLEIARRVVARDPNPIHLEHRGSTAQERAAHVHRENQVDVEDRRDVALTDLLKELLLLRSQLVSLLVSLSPHDLNRPVSAPPGQEVPATRLLASSDRHAKAHIELLRATARQSGDISPKAAVKFL
jgi:hypothetical protein